MRQKDLEQRLLDLAYTTDARITAPAFAYYAPCSLEEAHDALMRMAQAGTLTHESDDQGNVSFALPHRTQGPPPPPRGRAPAAAPIAAPTAVTMTPFGPPPVMNNVMMMPAPRASPPLSPPRPPPAPASGGHVACAFCAELVLAAARKCKHCGEILDPTMRSLQVASPVQVNVQNHQQMMAPQVVVTGREVSAGVAALLSFFWPGAGQIYCGHVAGGLLWMFGVFLGYVALIIPGLILHVLCIISATSTANAVNAARTRILLPGG